MRLFVMARFRGAIPPAVSGGIGRFSVVASHSKNSRSGTGASSLAL